MVVYYKRVAVSSCWLSFFSWMILCFLTQSSFTLTEAHFTGKLNNRHLLSKISQGQSRLGCGVFFSLASTGKAFCATFFGCTDLLPHADMFEKLVLHCRRCIVTFSLSVAAGFHFDRRSSYSEGLSIYLHESYRMCHDLCSTYSQIICLHCCIC